VQTRRSGPKRPVLLVSLLAVAIVVAGFIALVVSSASLSADTEGLANVNMPLGGGKIERVLVTRAPSNEQVSVELRGNQIWPRGRIGVGQRLSIDVVVKRPGIISWLTGSTERVHLDLVAPSASVKTPFVTLRPGEPLRVHFTQPVQVVAYGQPGALKRHSLSSAEDTVELPRSGPAGSLAVAAAPRRWERPSAQAVSWFPAGTQQASAVASPAPGSKIGPTTPITLTFSKSVDHALGGHLPPVSPNTPGTWRATGDHTIVFQPDGYGYGLGATVKVPLPSGVQLVGGQQGASGTVGTWSVPPGSTSRLQQLLALLGYLPLNFNYSGGGVALTPSSQVQAAVNPPAGTFGWRWGNVPGALRSMWKPGTAGTMTKGALMAFENDRNMTADGVPGPDVWRALMRAVISGKRSTFGYTFVTVSEGSPETESTWHNGSVVVSGLVNTGIPERPTALGVYPVFEHAPSVTMSGTNPDGSHYSDPGVPYVSYFNGGDALHGFVRGSYGSAQSLGCVEMPYDEASHVYRYTPIGTLVNVT
jgi:L,D-transpeptidase catalytic domain